MGDPSGIGPEVCMKALATLPHTLLRRIVVIGDSRFLINRRGAKVIFSEYDADKPPPPGSGALIDMKNSPEAGLPEAGLPEAGFRRAGLPGTGIETGKISAAAGKASAAYIRKAAELCMSNELAGIITAPINKKAFSLARPLRRTYGVPFKACRSRQRGDDADVG